MVSAPLTVQYMPDCLRRRLITYCPLARLPAIQPPPAFRVTAPWHSCGAVAAVLIPLPLGISIALLRPGTGPQPDAPPTPVRTIPVPVLIILAVAVGCAGGIYGIGGGSMLAPVLVGSGRKPAEVAPAALASTFVTAVAGVITFTILAIRAHVHAAPDWPTGIALGVGGLAGAYTGARIQSRLPGAVPLRCRPGIMRPRGIRCAAAEESAALTCQQWW